MTGGCMGNDASPERDDRIMQHSVLVHLTIEHPMQLTEADVIRELTTDPEAFEQRDPVLRAIRDLVRVGLAHRHGPFVLPTRAAVYAADLFEEKHYE